MRCLLVGLGNPGIYYYWTRHNVGARLIRLLAQRFSVTLKRKLRFQGEYASIISDNIRAELFIPELYMNQNGLAVEKILRQLGISTDSLLVIHDDIDIKLGEGQIRWNGGNAGHNGLRNITAKTGTANYFRLRIGVGRPPNKDSTERYVLSRPPQQEEEMIDSFMNQSFPFLEEFIADPENFRRNKSHSQNIGGQGLNRIQ